MKRVKVTYPIFGYVEYYMEIDPTKDKEDVLDNIWDEGMMHVPAFCELDYNADPSIYEPVDNTQLYIDDVLVEDEEEEQKRYFSTDPNQQSLL